MEPTILMGMGPGGGLHPPPVTLPLREDGCAKNFFGLKKPFLLGPSVDYPARLLSPLTARYFSALDRITPTRPSRSRSSSFSRITSSLAAVEG